MYSAGKFLAKKYQLMLRLDIKLQITQTESKFINSLVTDCITYRLSERESLEYIETRFKRISIASFKRRKANIQSDKSAQNWLNYFCRIGFVTQHRELMENVQLILDDSNRRLLTEQQRQVNDANREIIANRIDRLKEDIRESVILLSELSLGSPIIAQIKAKMNDLSRNNKNVYSGDYNNNNNNMLGVNDKENENGIDDIDN